MIARTVLSIALTAMASVAAFADEAKPPIKIAVLDALSGPYAHYGQPSVYGAKFVFDKINSEGGLFGRKIEIQTVDGGCAPKDSVGGATRLAADSAIVAVVGLTCTAAALAVKDSVAGTAPFPFISYSGGGHTSASQSLGGLRPNFFFISTPLYGQAGSAVNFAMNELKPRRIAFIGQAGVFSDEAQAGVNAMLKQYGADLVATETAEAQATDLTPQILKLRAANPDLVIAFLYDIPAMTFLRQANELKFDPYIVNNGSIVNTSVFKSLPPDALRKHYASSVLGLPMTSEAMKPAMDELKAKNPGVDFNWLSLLAIAGSETLAQAMKNAGPNLTAATVRDELEKLNGFKTSTLAYDVSFSPQSHMAGKGMRIFSIRDGAEVAAGVGYWPSNEKAAAPIAVEK